MSKTQYELLLISDGGLTAEENQKLLEKHKEVIKKAGGKILAEAPWGRRKLAYEIQKKRHGIFQLLYLEGPGSMVEETKRQMGYDEQVLKYFLTVVEDFTKTKKEFEALLADPAKNAKLVTDVLGA
ncbi:MAG: 30S ribosomal protein S6 [Candidatus Lambdaproteobacteria bacterium RIFOXYD1_FULL_56_27]|uniref:Small ribosomal subunit protein bS6 n=1 Tax=Candidatus Lambdaproteobacteria bacterium RIFOXYD2_FULL_56_26 TaxID=1817773 RepID=A0A1F6GRM6_9PROT|nr:MAG: 30S ribosomal protein S6 [Candidatus Lambdaproteobacteria bacterium RIFOXYC1_FULL_56_13]OGH00785.1 MAG: 30S ribosomal protein S6 [Candidatus Lambdaproteobacteria bacterium RIFOXYD2_FULL_56_26]OGH09950.1 MAG: 30S ribosomal protein S6 [Candidatus Lambdaproteobacteria bacterium RIFOXYD1_FULL_56_27]